MIRQMKCMYHKYLKITGNFLQITQNFLDRQQIRRAQKYKKNKQYSINSLDYIH